MPFVCEISVIIARAANGQSICYDVPRNEHVNGILRRSSVPANIDADIADRACAAAKSLADALDYVGVLALEFFVLEDGALLANEFAPRVHNSGHWTPEACATGQFEQHIRAVAGWPLGDVTRYHVPERFQALYEFDHNGGSAIIDPRGEVVAGVLTDEEGILVADADLSLARACKVASDPAGHYSRPDLFRLEVDGREIYPGDRG